jgi:hypothetical protein
MPEESSSIERAVETLARLRRHVGAVRQGEKTARDDLAVVLHLLVGSGSGYGVIRDAVDSLGIDPPSIAAWEADIPNEIDGSPVILGIRTLPYDDNAPLFSLPDFLKQTCLRFAAPGVEPEANWSWEALIRKVRNKFGGHADSKPPTWLQDLRYYPVADTDAVTFLLWSIGEAVLAATTRLLHNQGVDIDVFQPDDHYLDGISLQMGYVLAESDEKFGMQAFVSSAHWASGRRRAILGAQIGDRPVIFGLEADGRLVLTRGQLDSSLLDLERSFRSTIGPPGRPNRAARRAADKRNRKK